MNPKTLFIALLIGSFLALSLSASQAGRPVKPTTGTPPPPLNTPVASPR